MNDHTIAAPVCKFEEGCHRVVPCEPGCGAASPSVGPSALCVAEALEHGPVRCPLCPDGLVLHTPDGARAHFTHVHPEQPLVGPGPWPMLGELPVDRAALRDRIAEAALRAVEIAMEDTLLPAAREEALAGIAAVLPAPADRAAEGLAKHVVRAIFALKSPTPPGSEHYRAGWDDGVEAAMDAARDAVLHRLATEAAAPVVGVAADTTPDETLCRCGHGKAYHDAKYADPQCRLCPEDGERMWRHAYTPVVPARPGNDTKTTEDRPRCPDCRAKGHAVGAADKTPVVAYRSHSGSLLRCLTHAPDQTALDGGAFHPVTAGDLPDGGVCTYRAPGVECGADVLNPQKP